jgi:tetratricopeptide (TPR) repeat protein
VQLLARLEHPGIARVYATGTFERAGERCPYYTMELVEDAHTLLEHAERRGLALAERLALFLQACDAVAYGHRRGVIHRDLKPGNLLVDGRGRLAVIDFGLARPNDPQAFATQPLHTRAGLVFGTLPYMSPEHVCGRPFEIDTQSDVYSLGCILCELIGGRPPHELLDVPIRTALERIEREDPRLPDGMPRELAWIVGRAVARERSRRYASAGALADDLRRYLAGEPVDAAPPSRVYALRGFARRHRGLFAAVVAVVLALAVGLVRTRSEAGAAQGARADAEIEAAVAGAVSTFLASLFTDLHAFSGGADARIVDFLPAAADRLAEVERNDARAILTSLVGQGYMNLGDLAAAEPHLADAVEIGARAFAPDSIHRLRIEMLWADWLEQSGRYLESRDLSADVLARGGKALEERDRFYVRYNLALCESRLGRHAEAESIFRDMLEHDLEIGASRARAVNLSHRLAGEISSQGRNAEARAAYENALAHCEDRPDLALYAATIRMDLAQVLHELGELDEAVRLLDLAGAAFAANDAPPTNRVLCALNRVQILLDLGDTAAAGDALRAAQRHADELHATTRVHAYLAVMQARVLAAHGDLRAAEAAGERALALAVELAGPEGELANDVRAQIAEMRER